MLPKASTSPEGVVRLEECWPCHAQRALNFSKDSVITSSGICACQWHQEIRVTVPGDCKECRKNMPDWLWWRLQQGRNARIADRGPAGRATATPDRMGNGHLDGLPLWPLWTSHDLFGDLLNSFAEASWSCPTPLLDDLCVLLSKRICASTVLHLLFHSVSLLSCCNVSRVLRTLPAPFPCQETGKLFCQASSMQRRNHCQNCRNSIYTCQLTEHDWTQYILCWIIWIFIHEYYPYHNANQPNRPNSSVQSATQTHHKKKGPASRQTAQPLTL